MQIEAIFKKMQPQYKFPINSPPLIPNSQKKLNLILDCQATQKRLSDQPIGIFFSGGPHFSLNHVTRERLC